MKTPLKLLLIEDSEDDVELLLRELKKNNFDVIYDQIQTRSAMIDALNKSSWDIIISDFELPLFSGAKALEVYKEMNLEIPFIVVSGNIGETTAVEMMRAGAHDYLMKDKLTRLVPAINRELQDAALRRQTKLTELALRESESKYQQYQKLESIGALAGGIAHDFNNILNIIIGHVLLLEQSLPNSDHKERIETILSASNRGTALVKQLLSFARKTPRKLDVVQVNSIISELIKLLNEIFPKQITINAFLDDQLPSIICDVSEIHQVLLNLCVNGRDAMPNGGDLVISTNLVSKDKIIAKHPTASANQYIQIDVIDTGSGMDEETKKRIFEPFFTTKEIGKGTGLGLSVVFGIIESHNGFIQIESQVGKGTTFSIFCPVIEEKPGKVVKTKPALLADVKGGNEIILFVEDEDALREFVREILENKGYMVLTAPEGVEGLRIFNLFKETINLVISDNEMPRMNGIELIRQIKDISPKTKTIFATGNTEAIKNSNPSFNTDSLLEKPYDIVRILQIVRNVLDS